MNIAEFAKLADRTPQAIYQRLKENGIKLSELKEADGKTLTQEGLSILGSLFSVKEKEIDLSEEIKESGNKFDKKIILLERKLEELTEENNQLKISLAETRATAAAKDQIIEALRARAEYAEKITLQRLPAPAKPSLWQRITGRGKHQETPSTESK